MTHKSKSASAERAPHGKTLGTANPAGFPLAITQITLDDTSPLHLYEQLSRAIREAILSGDLPSGTLLPSGRELSDALGIARTTIVTAYSRLTAEGFIQTNRRRGTRVADRALISRHGYDDRSANASENEPAANDGFQWPTGRQITIGFRARHALEVDSLANTPADMGTLDTPDPCLYPRNTLSRLLADEFARPPSGNGTPDGKARFQTAMVNFLRHMRGVNCEPEQIVPVTNLKSALDLTAMLMLDPGHCVYVENPAREVVRASLRQADAQIVDMPTDSHGADISAISGPPPRLIVTSPSIGFPFGQQMSETRRVAMLETARNANAAIFECDAQWELFYSGGRLRALQGHYSNAPIFYFGSLSETLGPHIRAGYLVVPQHLLKPFEEIARRGAQGPEPFVLGALATFIENSDYAVHTKMVRAVYADRLRSFVDNLKALLPGVTVIEPTGGLNLTLLFDDGTSDEEVHLAAQAKGLSVTPLSRFYRDSSQHARQGLVLGIGIVPNRMIETMIQRLCEAVADVRRRQQRAA